MLVGKTPIFDRSTADKLMKIPGKIPFAVADRNYEVRVWREHDYMVVQSFREDEPVGLRFSVSHDTRSEFELYRGEEAVAQLVQIAIGDVIRASSAT